jgi:hypothetical protein
MGSETRGQPSAQDTGTFVGLDELAVRFGDLARSLQLEDDPDRTLEQIVQAAIEMIPGCDEGSISVVLGRRKVSSPGLVERSATDRGRGSGGDRARTVHGCRVRAAHRPRG